MSELPTLPLFVDDFEAATAHLTFEEDGAYNRLMRLCWRSPGCTIPDDVDWIRRRMRATVDEFDRVIAPILEEFFKRRNGRVFQKRLLEEYHYVLERKRVRKNASKAAVAAKARKRNENGPTKHRTKRPSNVAPNVAPNTVDRFTTQPNPTHLSNSRPIGEEDREPGPAPNEPQSGDPLDTPAFPDRSGRPLYVVIGDWIVEHAGMIEANGPIRRDIVKTWLDGGATEETIRDAVTAVVKQNADKGTGGPRKIRSIRYFEGAVKDRQKVQRAPAGSVQRGWENTKNWPETRWQRAVRGFHKDGSWSGNWGPTPNDPACLAPKELLDRSTPVSAGDQQADFKREETG